MISGDQDLCPYCGHDGLEEHDMRSAPPECGVAGCYCGHRVFLGDDDVSYPVVRVALRPDGTVDRWNGFVRCPYLSRDTVAMIMDAIAGDGGDRWAWHHGPNLRPDGTPVDVLMITGTNDGYTDYIAPEPDGSYAIDQGYVWSLVEDWAS